MISLVQVLGSQLAQGQEAGYQPLRIRLHSQDYSRLREAIARAGFTVAGVVGTDSIYGIPLVTDDECVDGPQVDWSALTREEEMAAVRRFAEMMEPLRGQIGVNPDTDGGTDAPD